jgi:hypothetical protein
MKLIDEYHLSTRSQQCHYHKKRALHFSKGNVKNPENEIKSSKPKKKKERTAQGQ